MARTLGKIRDVLAAQRALLAARRRLDREPVGSLTARRGDAPAPAPSGDATRARQIAAAVRWTARHGLFRPFCLVQALALQELLAAAGVRGSEIRVGVQRQDGQFAAHAWVRWNNEVLGDDPRHVATFTEVDDIGVLGRR
ncbi:MAG: lasso peptide biosynthesis B2 protein [Gemmatimonadaceae bacterium]|nr:lasso peptide biosynthesis B2 protein [Gemmatimonadaceae bacterium]